jgi:hypothetical protein
MRPVKLNLAGVLLIALATVSCQRTEENEELKGLGETTVVAVPDTAAPVDTTPEVTPPPNQAQKEPAKEIVIVREREEVRPEPRRVPPPRPVRRVEEPGREVPREVERPAPRPATATVPAGTNFFVTTESELSSQSNQVGDPVAARTAENINVDGRVVIPAGAMVEGHVTAIKSAGNPGELSYIDLAFDRVRLANGEWKPISGVLAGRAGEEVKGKGNVPRNVAIGAGAGAILGRVIGGDTKGAVIGAVIGAGAGVAASEATRDTYIVVPSGSRLNVQLTSAVSVPVR